jgi:hypothetical protein
VQERILTSKRRFSFSFFLVKQDDLTLANSTKLDAAGAIERLLKAYDLALQEVYTLRAQQKGKTNPSGPSVPSTPFIFPPTGPSVPIGPGGSLPSSASSFSDSVDIDYEPGGQMAQALVLFKEMALTLKAIENNP